MDLTLDLVLLIAALLCFIASALNVGSPRVSLLPLGLAFWILAAIL
jgi:hypothetical protein